MTTYIYMNEQIRKAKPSRPVIVAQQPGREVNAVREANLFDIWHKGVLIGTVQFDPKGLAVCETHDVKAWVEFTGDVIVSTRDATSVQPDPNPVASEKKPNTPIDFKMKFR